MSILSLTARLGMDATGFHAGMTKAGRQAEQFASGLKGQLAGAFSTAAILGYAKSVADHVNRIKDLSEQYRITTDDVQRLDFAAKQSGLQFENVGRMLDNVNKAREEAATKGGESNDAFGFFGIGADQYNNAAVSTLDIVKRISEEMQKMELNPTVERAFAQLAGEKGLKLLSVIQEINNTRISIIDQAEIERIDIAIKKLEKAVLLAKTYTASFVGQFLAGMEPKKDETLRNTLRRVIPSFGLLGIADKFFLGNQKIKEEQTTKTQDTETQKAIAEFIKIPGLFQKAFNPPPEKVKAEKEVQAITGKIADGDSLARIGGFTGAQQQADKIEPLVKQIVSHLQRGIKVQEL